MASEVAHTSRRRLEPEYRPAESSPIELVYAEIALRAHQSPAKPFNKLYAVKLG